METAEDLERKKKSKEDETYWDLAGGIKRISSMMSWYEKGLSGLLHYAGIHCFTERCRMKVDVEDPC
ncbi:hypothetical protein C5167_031886 [Papaver somniferum]|uniref:Uncharacterized protein n=1 Tax=Papaver somniferum TaxID=3469 RepID=A0A4Y7K5R3_PAPSO|nr:hypothetical protein C5167_031886 [Papaver somniferum]